MEERPGYRRHIAVAYAWLYRPFRPAGRCRSGLDHIAACWWTRLDITVYRHLGLSVGVRALGVTDVLLLRTRGRRSGQVREVLVAYVQLGTALVVCAANGGGERDPAWFANLRAGGPVEIEQHGRRRAVAAVVLEGNEREQALVAVSRSFPHVRLYLSRTSRSFPLVRLEPIDMAEPGPASAAALGSSRTGPLPISA
ncbi:MAG: nitroreductase family deazaflavin-dependent oxidoreductase [Acidimicrobiales bacterium]